jgi:hypothetical protein
MCDFPVTLPLEFTVALRLCLMLSLRRWMAVAAFSRRRASAIGEFDNSLTSPFLE